MEIKLNNQSHTPPKGKSVTVEIEKRPDGDIYIMKNGTFVENRSEQEFLNGNGESLFKNRSVIKGTLKDDGTIHTISYVPLHSHSGYSLLDGVSHVSEMVEAAEEAMALTDHGNMYGALEFYQEMKKAGKKPILGCEVYSETIDGVKDGNHLLLLAETTEGYYNLVKLVSKSHENFYKKPHISYDMLRKHSKGLIATSACLGGELSQSILMDDMVTARRVINEMISIFGKENYFIEIQRHDLPEENVVNPELIRFAEEFDLGLVATADSHYTHEEDKEAQDVLLCVSTGTDMNDEDRMTLPGNGYHIHSSEEMYEKFKDIPEALDNTVLIADRCNAEIETGVNHMPHIEVPEEFNNEKEYFEHLCWEGFRKRFEGTDKFHSDEYKDRLEFEMSVINDMGFPGYFLIMWDVIQFAKSRNILVGPGRGSACGSLVAYVLEITKVDPIPFGLLFERFLNPDRYSMPDIDTDFPDNRREEVIEYAREKYGERAVARIVTITRLTAKYAVQDVGRALGYPFAKRLEISNKIPAKPGMTLEKALDESQEFKTMYEEDEDTKNIVDMALRLENAPKSTGIHACFTGDSLVMTKDGHKMIEEIEVGDEVLTHKKRYKPVVSTMTSKTDKVYTIYPTSAAPIQATGNHPFLVKEMTYKRVRTPEINTKVKTFGESMWKEVSELEVGKDYVGIPINDESKIPHSSGKLPFKEKAFWWLIGRYIADGWTESHDRKYVNSVEERVIICCTHKHENDKNDILQRLNELGFKYRVEKVRTTYKIHIQKDGLYDYLQSFGRYAHGKHLNQDVLSLPVLYAKEFLDGYLGADGYHLVKHDRYSFKTVSKQLALDLSHLVHKAYKRHVGVGVLPPKVETIEGRKVNSKEKYEIKFTKDVRKREQSIFHAEDGYIWSRVRDVTVEEREETMYNLTVLDDSSYTVHNVAVHNCGVIIAPGDIDNYAPTMLAEDRETGERVLTTQFTMSQCEDVGLLKMDFLGLRTMRVLEEGLSMINEFRRATKQLPPMDIEDIKLGDVKVYKNLSKGNTAGVFQLEGPGMTNTVKQMLQDVETDEKEENIEYFLRLIAMISLYRPGPMDEIPNYVKNMQDESSIHYDAEELKPYLQETKGIIVYQEQVMQAVRELAGFSRGQADEIRKGMGKKIVSIVNKFKDPFIYGSEELGISGCVPNGVPEEVAKDIWHKMEKFSEYAFNKSHATGYGVVAAQTGWMATYYPVQYYTATMNSFLKTQEKVQKYISLVKDMGIEVLPPDVNHSKELFSVEGKNIRFGIKGIRGLGKTAQFLLKERDENGNFESYPNFVYRMVRNQDLKKNVLKNLIYSGALDEFEGTRMEKVLVGEELIEQAKFIRDVHKKNRGTLLTLPGILEEEMFAPELNGEKELPREFLLEKEKENAGFYVTGHPMEQYQASLNKPNYRTMGDVIDEMEERMEQTGDDTFTIYDKISLAGVVTDTDDFTTKRTGDPLRIATVEDETGRIKCTIFSDLLMKHRGMFDKNNLLFLEGQINVYQGEIRFVVNNVMDLHALERSETPVQYTIIGHKNKEKARKQYKEIVEYVTHPKDEVKDALRVPLIFIQNGKSFDMGVTIPHTPQTQEDIKDIVGRQSLKAKYG